MGIASDQISEGHASTPLVVCIAGSCEERTRLARMFDGVGVLVMAADAGSARTFLGGLDGTELREDEPASSAIHFGGLRLDPAQHDASWQGHPLHLTTHELKVLACLAGRPGRAWTHQQLHEHAWDEPFFTGPAAVQSVVKRLRAKLRRLGLPIDVQAVRGVGFRLAARKGLHLVR
jgi:DNA-binding response OmpR family regulator